MQVHSKNKYYSFPKNSWFQLMRTLRWCLSASFFKAGRKLVSLLSRMAFPPGLFMSRRLLYLLHVCSIWQKICSAMYVVGNASSFTFPKVLENVLHLIQNLTIRVYEL